MGCKWLGYDPLEHEEVCMLNDEHPIGDIVSCDPNNLTYNQELLLIEEIRGK